MEFWSSPPPCQVRTVRGVRRMQVDGMSSDSDIESWDTPAMASTTTADALLGNQCFRCNSDAVSNGDGGDQLRKQYIHSSSKYPRPDAKASTSLRLCMKCCHCSECAAVALCVLYGHVAHDSE